MLRVSYSPKEMERLSKLEEVRSRQITQKEAGIALGISSRQVRRLLIRTKLEGSLGVKSLPKGGNRRMSIAVQERIVSLLSQKQYRDFGPTFASEKLEELHGIKASRETVRKLMAKHGLWIMRQRARSKHHQSRTRRARFGELVQIDGSHHSWFEERGQKCCLLVFIDDATSKIVSLRFEKAETTLGYFRAMSDHLTQYGRPIAYYSDKHSIFKQTHKNGLEGRLAETQFKRATRELGIELICAHSSQAKGRVERANSTLQDRLIKEMRLRNIASIEDANNYLPEFLEKHNAQFARPPQNSQDAHRTLYHDKSALHNILSIQDTRRLTKNLELSLDSQILQIQTIGTGYRYRNATVEIFRHLDDSLSIFYGTQKLAYKVFEDFSKQPDVVDSKELNTKVDSLITASLSSQQPFQRLSVQN